MAVKECVHGISLAEPCPDCEPHPFKVHVAGAGGGGLSGRDEVRLCELPPGQAGLRFDDGKNKLELIPAEWIWALGDVLTQGAKKYAERNWEKGMKWGKMIGCALRHTFRFVVGERYDPETGCHHLAMAAWNMLALMSYDLRGIGENDLPKTDLSIIGKVNSGEGTNGKKET